MTSEELKNATKAESQAAELSYVTMKPHEFKQNPNRPKAANRRFKTGRQIASEELRYLQLKKLGIDTPSALSITAPPSLKPRKHYCDITGLEGKYKSPSSALRFHNVEIYQEVIRHMTPGLDQEYLSLRGANVILK